MSVGSPSLAELEAWDYDAAVKLAEPILWRYLSKSASVLNGTGGEHVKELALEDLRRLISCHLISAAVRDDLLGCVERVLKRMPASVARKRETFNGFVRGRVDWPATVSSRVATADPTVFVCEPVDRRYDTPLGRLLKLSLYCMAELGPRAGFSSTAASGHAGLEAQAATLAKRSARLQKHPKLRQVRLVDRHLLRHLDATGSRFPEVGPLIDFVDLFYKGLTLGNVEALRELLNRQVFAPGSNDRLFELIVGLRLLESLEAEGYRLSEPLTILPASGTPFASLSKAGSRGLVWWQRSLWPVVGADPMKGRWRRVLSENQVDDPRPLMPDFVLHLPERDLVYIVEVKLSAVGAQRERDGLRDVLAYMADVEAAGLPSPKVRALVVAWNASGAAQSIDQQVSVTSQARLQADAQALIARAQAGAQQ